MDPDWVTDVCACVFLLFVLLVGCIGFTFNTAFSDEQKSIAVTIAYVLGIMIAAIGVIALVVAYAPWGIVRNVRQLSTPFPVERGNPMVMASPIAVDRSTSGRELERGNPMAGIQNMQLGGSYIISKPAEAPDCFGYYYDHASEDSREPGCEDMCRFFTDCIRATHSSLNFEQETRLPVEDTQERGEQMQSKDLESRREKALSLEVIPAGDTFLVKSSTRKGGYMVTPEDDGTHHCACMDYATHRGDSKWRCKHILAVEMFLEERGPTRADSRFDVIDIK